MSVDTQRLQNLKARVDNAKTQKVQAETRMVSLREQRDQVVAELKALNLTPETLEAEIARLDGEETRLAAEVETLLQGA